MAVQGTFTYDPATQLGLLRLMLPGETNIDTAVLADEELTALLNLHGDVRLAAADALDIIASSLNLIMRKVTFTGGVTLNGPETAAAFRVHAKELRKSVDESPDFDWAEMVLDPFSERERWEKQFLRGIV